MPREAVSHLRTVATKSGRPVSAEDLLRRLVDAIERDGNLRQATALRQAGDQMEEVLFEADVDGESYVLVRCRRKEPPPMLSPRELAIARLIAKGLPNKSIGDILEISPWTVATHLRRIFIKLSVNSRAAMVARLSTDNLL